MNDSEQHQITPTAKPRAASSLRWTLASLLVGLLVPPATLFSVQIFIGHRSASASLAEILRNLFSTGQILIVLFGLIPFIVLSAVCEFAARRLPRSRVACLAIGGIAGIAAYMIPAHVDVWYPLYDGSRSSGPLAVLAFVFIPFYCLGTLAVGLVAGWAVSLLPRFSVEKAGSRWSFSLWTLFVVMTVVAAVCGLLGFLVKSFGVVP